MITKNINSDQNKIFLYLKDSESLTIFKNNFYDKTDLDVVDIAGNVYNRLIIFNAQTIHAASEYFGDAKENSRLFQIFFFDAE